VITHNVDALKEDAATCILNYQPDAIRELRSFCEQRYPNHTHLETYYYPDGRLKSLGFFAPGADKGTALSLLMDRLDIATEEVLAIGDNPNDLPMFACARVKVAMGNATGDVKHAATVIAPDHNDEGVAWAVERFVLQ
jgi:HAD superfamily hydrolase (TIGR01484 family)